MCPRVFVCFFLYFGSFSTLSLPRLQTAAFCDKHIKARLSLRVTGYKLQIIHYLRGVFPYLCCI